MSDEELDLIAALAAGELDATAAARAEDLIAQGGVYREEFDAQLQANAALADVAPATMSDLERARLHRAVMAEISAPPQQSDVSRMVRWLRPLAVAAAAIVVVGFGGLLLGNLGAGDTAADFAPLAGTTTAPSDRDESEQGRDDAFSSGAATEDMAQVSEGDVESLPPRFEAAAMPDLGSVSSREIDDEYLTNIFLGAAQFTVDAPGTLDVVPLSCAPTAGSLSEEEPLLAFGTAQYDGEGAQYFGFASRRLVFLDAVTCSVLGEHPEP